MEFKNRIRRILRDSLLLFILVNTRVCNSVSTDENLRDSASTIVRQFPAAAESEQDESQSKFGELITSGSFENDIVSSESVAVNRLESIQDSREVISAPYNPEITADSESAASEDDPQGPPDHTIPYSEHEEPADVPTRPKYTAPGEWAKPPPEKNIPLDFVPTKLYAQVRGTHTVKRLPREEAIRNAKTAEEKKHAPRLREVVTNSKVNTVYTEEGYEDAAYDHAGHIRDADFHEGFARKLQEDVESDRKSANGRYKEKSIDEPRKRNEELTDKGFEEYDDDYSGHLGETVNYKTNIHVPVGEDRYDSDYERVRNVWRGSDVDPKVVVEGGVQELEKDLEKEAAEVERGSELYDSVKLHSTEDDDESKYEENEKQSSAVAESRRDYDDEKGTERPDVIVAKKRKSKTRGKSLSRNRGDVEAPGLGSRGSSRVEWKERPNKQSYETTVVPFQTVPTNTKSFDTTTKLRRVPQPDLPLFNAKEKLSYTSQDEDSMRSNGDSTTADYGRLFWDFFKARENDETTISQARFVQEATTLSPQLEQQAPIALGTVHSRGPYFLVTQQESTTLPSVFLSSQAYISQTLPSVLNPAFRNHSGDNQLAIGQSGNWNAARNSKEFIDFPTAAAYTNLQPSVTQFDAYRSWTTVPTFSVTLSDDLTSSSTTVDSETRPPEIDSKLKSEFDDNPFLSPLVRDAYASAMNRSKSRYKVLVRHDPKRSSKNRQKPKQLKENAIDDRPLKESSKVFDQTERNKFIWRNNGADYVRGLAGPAQGGEGLPAADGESSLQDFTIMRPPPVPRQSGEVTYSDFLPYHPRGKSTDRPSVSLESETTRERGQKKLPLSFERHRVRPHKLAVVPSTPFEHSSVVGQTPGWFLPVRTFFPPTMLRPPPPLLPPAGHNGYKKNRLAGDYHTPSYHSANQYKKYSHAKRFVPVAFESAWNGENARRKRRSAAAESKEHVSNRVYGLKAGLIVASNGDAGNDGEVEQNDKVSAGRKRNLSTSPVRTVDVGNVAKQRIKKDSDISEKSYKSTPRRTPLEEITRKNKLAKNVNKNHVIESETASVDKVFQEDIPAQWTLDFPKSAKINSTANEGKTLQSTGILSDGRKIKRRLVARRAPPVGSKSRNYRQRQEELLNEAPKIAGDVIDKELNARFNEDKEDDKTNNEDKVEVEVPEFDFAEELAEENHAKNGEYSSMESSVNTKKYPFYSNDKIPSTSVLKYIVDPQRIPHKTFGGMEFYNSRDAYKECEEVEPTLDEVLPDEEEPVPDRGLKEDLPRLRGLGNKLDCFKAKFFDENPLDNPLFLEDHVEDPQLPTELDPKKFQSRILAFPKANDEYIVQKNSKKPEAINSLRQAKPFHRMYPKTHQLDYRYGPRDGKFRNGYYHSVRQSAKGIPVKRHRLQNQRPQYQRQRIEESRKRLVISTTESPALSLTTPYQRLVYEDVMGNIKNSVNSDGNYPKVTVRPTTKLQGNVVNIKNLNTQNFPPNFVRDKNSGAPLVAITENPRENLIDVEGLYPPPYQYVHAQSNFHKVNKIPYRPKSYRQISPSSSRMISHLKRIRVQKRNAGNHEDEEKSFHFQKKMHSIVRRSVENVTEKANETKLQTDFVTEIIEFILPTLSTDLSSTTAKPILKITTNTTQNVTSTKPSNVNDDQKVESSQKVVYTIRDRIRHSKPRNEISRVGKFTRNETTVNNDSRRKEPTYNNVRNRKLRTNQLTDISITSPNKTSEETLNSSTVTSASTIIVEHKLPSKENVQDSTQYSTRRKKKVNIDPSEIPENQTVVPSASENQDIAKTEPTIVEARTVKNYDVHENVQEDIVATTLKSIELTTSEEFARLKAYLESDPPGYAEAFPEEFRKTSNTSNSDESNISEASLPRKSEEKEEEKEAENISKNRYESLERSSSDEESTEQDDEAEKSPSKVSTKKEDDDSSSKDVKSSQEDKPFFRYTERPYSPPENYEDIKYMDLGPRVNKPAFYHPPFPVPDYERYRERKDRSKWITSEEKDENGKYIFPWERDKEEDLEDRAESRFHSYEYPWEKRERLAKERRRRKRKRGFFSDEDDDDVSFTKKREKYVYPWERYDVPSADHVNSKRNLGKSGFAKDGLSSENRPVVKYSSRYNDEEKIPLGNDQPFIPTVSPRKFDKIERAPLIDDIDDISITSGDSNYQPTFAMTKSSKLEMSLDPEDIVSTPNRKSRRQMTQIEKTASYELISESMEEPDAKKLTRKKMIKKSTKKRNKNNFDDADSEVVTTNSPDTTTTSAEIINPRVTAVRKQRKRKILTKPLNNTSRGQSSVQSSTESNRIARRKIRTSTSKPTTTTTPSRNVRRKQQISESSNKKKIIPRGFRLTSTDPSASVIDEPEVEDSTPPGRTVEHRSSVSKEKLVTKTVYPNDESAFSTDTKKRPTRNRSSTNSAEVHRNVKPFESRNGEKVKDGEHGSTAKNESVEKISIITKKTPGRVYRSKEIDKDGVKGTFITITPNNSSDHQDSSQVLDFNGKELQTLKTLKELNAVDRADDAEPTLTPESYVIGNLLQNAATSTTGKIPGQWSKDEESHEDEESLEQDNQEKRRILSRARVIKDPQKRLYYYVERR